MEGKLENLQKEQEDGLVLGDMILQEENYKGLCKDTLAREEILWKQKEKYY